MGGGTEVFPELGQHCQHPHCHQLDFLPFSCNRCLKVFCVEHRTYRSHECPKPDVKSRKVIVCETCSKSMETTGLSLEEESAMKEKHGNSKECDPSKNKKQRCRVTRCREHLTFSNSTICRSCDTKVCLKHRLPADHSCRRGYSAVKVSVNVGLGNNKFLAALAARNGKGDCAKDTHDGQISPTESSRSIEAC